MKRSLRRTVVKPFAQALALFAMFVAGFGILGTLPASAHNVLEATSPADGSTVASVPKKIVMTFDQPAIALGSAIELTGPGGPAQVSAAILENNTVGVDTGGSLPAGKYTATWRITSADGHPISGSWSFTARGAATYPVLSGPGNTNPPASGTGTTRATAPAAAKATGNGGSGLFIVLGVLVLALVIIVVVLVTRRRPRRGEGVG